MKRITIRLAASVPDDMDDAEAMHLLNSILTVGQDDAFDVESDVELYGDIRDEARRATLMNFEQPVVVSDEAEAAS